MAKTRERITDNQRGDSMIPEDGFYDPLNKRFVEPDNEPEPDGDEEPEEERQMTTAKEKFSNFVDKAETITNILKGIDYNLVNKEEKKADVEALKLEEERKKRQMRTGLLIGTGAFIVVMLVVLVVLNKK